ncbi:MAG: alkaline phosphatase [Opitutaceae bacterium]|nr:alkaline phosphatase [Opitutaceae bacterium]
MNSSLRSAIAGTALVAGLASPLTAQQAKNVILMISDGQGFNAVTATEYYTGSKAVYEGSDFVKVSMQTSSANNPAGYDPIAMWSDTNYQKIKPTDSASAATAMYTGVKNYDGQVNWSTTGQPLTTFFELAGQAGKAVGAVSSVEFSHATPAAVVSHNSSRNNYSAIANEAINNSHVTVLMGAGHPLYNDNGVLRTTGINYSYVGGQTTWNDITDADGANGFAFVDTTAGFEALANGSMNVDKVIGVAQAGTTLQQGRSNPVGNFDPLNTNVPTLSTMTKAALNVLDNDTDGFAVMIEGGAIDWAGHANQIDRTIEEQKDFNASVQSVVDYLNAGTNGNNWSNTLLIVTADHETGGLWGAANTFDQVGNNGVGVLPTVGYSSGDHTNVLVPLYAKGAGAEAFLAATIGTDTQLATRYGVDAAFNQYIDNTSVYDVVVGATAIPEPSTYAAIFGAAVLGLAGFRRMRRRAA